MDVMSSLPFVIILACIAGYCAVQAKQLREVNIKLNVQKEITAAILLNVMSAEDAASLIESVQEKMLGRKK